MKETVWITLSNGEITYQCPDNVECIVLEWDKTRITMKEALGQIIYVVDRKYLRADEKMKHIERILLRLDREEMSNE